MPKQVKVKVPATMANLGPGFDCIGMALDIWDTITITGGPFGIEIEGEGEGHIPLDARNLIITGVDAAFSEIGEQMPSLHYRYISKIPVGRGLGSSSASIVAGLLAGAAFAGADLPFSRLVRIAADIEGHPDNVAPALAGGCTIGIHEAGEWIVTSTPIPENLSCVLYIPDSSTSTHESRAKLPEQISRGDAVYNIGRAALLISSFASSDLSLLKYATQDKLHQPYRSSGFTGMQSIIDAALRGGAKGAFLSGSGPAIAALTCGNEYTVYYEMAEAVRIAQLGGRVSIVWPSRTGARVVDGEE